MSKLSKQQSIQMHRETLRALINTNHHRANCAKLLGITPQALGARIRKYRIESVPYTWAKLPQTISTVHVVSRKIQLDMDVVLREYRTGSTFTQLGIMFGCHASCIRTRLVSHLGTKYEAIKQINSDNRNRRK